MSQHLLMMHLTLVYVVLFAATAFANPLHSLSARAVTVPGYDYAGCYTEATSGRALAAKTTYSDDMTIQMCAATCSAYAWFGTEYGREVCQYLAWTRWDLTVSVLLW